MRWLYWLQSSLQTLSAIWWNSCFPTQRILQWKRAWYYSGQWNWKELSLLKSNSQYLWEEYVSDSTVLWKDKEMRGKPITSCQQNLYSEKDKSVSWISSLVGTSSKKKKFNMLKHDENIAKSTTLLFNCTDALWKYSECAFSFHLCEIRTLFTGATMFQVVIKKRRFSHYNQLFLIFLKIYPETQDLAAKIRWIDECCERLQLIFKPVKSGVILHFWNLKHV